MSLLTPILVVMIQQFSWSVAKAGKIEVVQESIQKSCGKSISSDEALRLVKDLYLNCVPNSKVEIEEKCQVACLKINSGSVVGQ